MFSLKRIFKFFSKKQYLSAIYIPKKRNNTYISKEEYQDLVSYAQGRNIKLARFKKYTGDIAVIKEVIDDIVVIANDFPRILEILIH